MKYEVTIGLEVHVQLRTKSKMFCACSTEYGAPPNTHVCPVCLGYPGSLPVINEDAIRYTVMTGLMLGSAISDYSKFDRKSYFYPDMPKNYQISQYDAPLCVGGAVEIDMDSGRKSIQITRIHLEEDVGKNIHYSKWSGVDFNRAGIPLMEIVSEPQISSPEEAFAYLAALKEILVYGGVSECSLEEGNMRCDVNCSVRPLDEPELGVKAEIKNLNTFKGVLNALKYEVERQIETIESGGRIEQETRRWDVDSGVTAAMRTKEYAHDYRYFPEPDLVPVVLDSELVREWGRDIPELPRERRERMVSEYGIPDYDAGVLAADRAVADYFEEAARIAGDAKAVSNWVMTEMLRLLSEKNIGITEIPMEPAALAGLVKLTGTGILNTTTAKEVFAELFEKGGDPAEMVKEKGLRQISDSGAIEELVDEAIRRNPKSAEDYRNGKKKALKFLIGQVMRASRGKADPRAVSEILEKSLDT
ncbi:MAG: Asp-tRNA(Asn)/Glu-tRNA(Gln) amidotransferase subunit GatB [Kiritimatiellia bacterium]